MACLEPCSFPADRWRRDGQVCDRHRFARHLIRLSNAGTYCGRHPSVYFAIRGDRVKVGSSLDPVQRAKDLGATLLGVIPNAGRRTEGFWLRYFGPARIAGTLEWFDARAWGVLLLVPYEKATAAA